MKIPSRVSICLPKKDEYGQTNGSEGCYFIKKIPEAIFSGSRRQVLGDSYYTLRGPPPPPPPSKSDKTISLVFSLVLDFNSQPLRRVPVVLCLGALTGPGEFCRFLRGGVPEVFSRKDPNLFLAHHRNHSELLDINRKANKCLVTSEHILESLFNIISK